MGRYINLGRFTCLSTNNDANNEGESASNASKDSTVTTTLPEGAEESNENGFNSEKSRSPSPSSSRVDNSLFLPLLYDVCCIVDFLLFFFNEKAEVIHLLMLEYTEPSFIWQVQDDDGCPSDTFLEKKIEGLSMKP